MCSPRRVVFFCRHPAHPVSVLIVHPTAVTAVQRCTSYSSSAGCWMVIPFSFSAVGQVLRHGDFERVPVLLAPSKLDTRIALLKNCCNH